MWLCGKCHETFHSDINLKRHRETRVTCDINSNTPADSEDPSRVIQIMPLDPSVEVFKCNFCDKEPFTSKLVLISWEKTLGTVKLKAEI